MAVGKVAAQLCLTQIIKELRIGVEQDRVVTTLNIIFNVVFHVNLPPTLTYLFSILVNLFRRSLLRKVATMT